MNLIDDIKAHHAELTAWRRDIHAHPELGFEEHRTADFVAQKLREFGLEVYTGIGKTGVVGALRVGNTMRSVGLRADMDALPIQEANTFDHCSKRGVMHACGHDGHTIMLLGAAKYLAATRNFDGQVYFIFQPAEEGIGGAMAMIEDGLFQQFPCDAVFGMHNRPTLPVGQFAVRSGAMMAGGAFFDIDITGNGAHGARPESGIDPIVVAAQMVTAIQSIVSRNLRPIETAVVSITQLHSGDAYNVIPHTARLSGTVRAFRKCDEDGRNPMKVSAEGWRGMGAQAVVDFGNIFLRRLTTPQQSLQPRSVTTSWARKMSSEITTIITSKTSLYVRAGPRLLITLAMVVKKGCEVHNPACDFNDDAIPQGAILCPIG